MYMGDIYRSLERGAYRAAWALTLGLGMACTPGKEEVKTAVPVPENPVREVSAQEQHRGEPYFEIPRLAENTPLKTRLAVAYIQLCNTVRGTKSWREGGLEVKRLEMDELEKYSKRFRDFNSGKLTDSEAQELIVEMKAYTEETARQDFEERQRGK